MDENKVGVFGSDSIEQLLEDLPPWLKEDGIKDLADSKGAVTIGGVGGYNIKTTVNSTHIDNWVVPKTSGHSTLKTPAYKFKELEYLDQLTAHVNGTYSEHYAGQDGKEIQATEFIIDAGHGTGFCIGSIMKYAKRYGKKNGYDKKDLMKILHYALIQLYIHDKEHKS